MNFYQWNFYASKDLNTFYDVQISLFVTVIAKMRYQEVVLVLAASYIAVVSSFGSIEDKFLKKYAMVKVRIAAFYLKRFNILIDFLKLHIFIIYQKSVLKLVIKYFKLTVVCQNFIQYPSNWGNNDSSSHIYYMSELNKTSKSNFTHLCILFLPCTTRTKNSNTNISRPWGHFLFFCFFYLFFIFHDLFFPSYNFSLKKRTERKYLKKK